MKKTDRASTLKNVAAMAGVSLSTASRVLSNSGYPVSDLLKGRILEAADKLNYTPNILARTLRSNTSHIIGVIVPTLQNPFFNQVILGIESIANKHDYEIMIFSSHRNIEQERKHINSLIQNRVMALIIISIDTESTTLKKYIDYGGKVALIESNFRLNHTIITETDYLGAAQLAVDYLIEKGHRKIAFLTAPLTKTYRRSILVGVEEAIKEYGIPFTEKDIFIATNETESETGVYEFFLGRQLVDLFFQSKANYTAIIAINDLTAFGIIQALNQRGVSVPQDISLISFDNIIYSEMVSPALTTVELPSRSMGASVCSMLLDSISNTNDKLTDVIFRFEGRFVERESVRKISR